MIERLISERLPACRARWKGVEIEPSLFVRHLSDRLVEGLSPEQLHIEDLYLACACGAGDPSALRIFEAELLPEVTKSLLRRRIPSSDLDEVRQLLRHRLFVGNEGRAPRITEYSGLGPLLHWVRIVAFRTAANLRRSQGPLREAAASAELEEIASADPELEAIKRRYRPDFEKAFRTAFATLPKRDRNVLRLHLLDGLGNAEIGRIYGVDNSTISRWMARSRKRVLDTTRDLLIERLEISQAECDSVVALVKSQLELSLRRLLESSQDLA